MGASRAMTIGALAEPALLVAVLALSVPAHSSNLPAIITRSLSHPLWLASPQRLLALVAFLIVIVAESGRLPVDNPSTHLELTMIHEAMVLEYAGPGPRPGQAGRVHAPGRPRGPLRRSVRPLGYRHRTGRRASGARSGATGAKVAALGVGVGRLRSGGGQAAPLPGARTAGRGVRALGAGRDLGPGDAVTGPFASTLTLAVGAVLVCAVTVLWLSSVRSVVRVVAAQGIALGLWPWSSAST